MNASWATSSASARSFVRARANRYTGIQSSSAARWNATSGDGSGVVICLEYVGAARNARWTPSGAPALHPEDAEARLRDRRMDGGLDPERQDAPRVERIDDAVVPQPRGREVRRALALVGLEDRCLEGVPSGVVRERPPDRRENARGLLAAHDRDPGIRPRPQESRLVGAPRHRVVAGPERAADQDRELRDL